MTASNRVLPKVRKGFADVAKIAIKAGRLDGGRIPLRVGPSGQVRTCIFADLSIAERPLVTAQQPLWVRPQDWSVPL